MRLPVRAGYDLNSEKKSGEDQLRRTTVLSMVSVGNSGGGDNPKNGDMLCNVLLALKAIEDVGIIGVCRIKCVNTLRDEEFCGVIISFPRGISRQVVECRPVEMILAGADFAFVLAVCPRRS